MRYIAAAMVFVSGLRGAAMALVCSAMLSSTAWDAAAPRPTPHQRLDRALAPVQQVIDELRVTEDERNSLSDLLARGEALAAEQVESTQRAEHARASAAEHAIVILARVVRGRIEAARAESTASEREQRATEAEANARQSRGALERAAERRMVIERDAERAQQQAQQPSTQPSTQPSSQPASRPRANNNGARPSTARPNAARPSGGAR